MDKAVWQVSGQKNLGTEKNWKSSGELEKIGRERLSLLGGSQSCAGWIGDVAALPLWWRSRTSG